MSGPISGPVIGQYFGIFNGVTKGLYGQIVATAPFDKCNLLILAFVRTVCDGTNYVAAFTDWRDDKFNFDPDDTDIDRVKLVVETARAKNPGIKILISLGWGAGDVLLASRTPEPFAKSVGAIVQALSLDGFDIDYELVGWMDPAAMLTLAQEIRKSLDGVTPKREMIMTITPARTSGGLNQSVLEAFTYTMPQSYDHGGDGATVDQYKEIIGSYERIVGGLNSEGYIGYSDHPGKHVAEAKQKGLAGIFAWRLDNDNVDEATRLPNFATGIEMWQLMKG